MKKMKTKIDEIRYQLSLIADNLSQKRCILRENLSSKGGVEYYRTRENIGTLKEAETRIREAIEFLGCFYGETKSDDRLPKWFV